MKLSVIILSLFLFTETADAQNIDKPNLILIVADDLGYGDVGFNGCKDIPTPHIDQIAGNGVRFENGYVSYAVCGPSRAGLITGRYQDRFGFGRNPLLAPNDPAMGLSLAEETLADVLKRSGYYSTAIGKWHLGSHPSLHPLKRGFDEFFGFLGGGHHYFPSKWTLNDESEARSQNDGYKTKLLRNTQPVDEQEYLTDALSREAVQFIAKNTERPFFLYLAYNAPHTPLQATENYLSRFKEIKDEKRKTYAAMVSAMDDGVGLVLNELHAKGIEKNTIVIFLSDNGGPEQANASDNGHLRGGKSDFWDGGIKVPFAIQWPAKIKPGTIYSKPVISLDIFATISAQIQAKINPEKALDGVNLLPFLSEENTSAPHPYLFWRQFDKKMVAVRTQNHKLVISRAGEELFDSTNDISEQHNTILQKKELFEKLLQNWKNWEEGLIDPVFLGLLQDKEYSLEHKDRFIFDRK